jgi:hypothetical protein
VRSLFFSIIEIIVGTAKLILAGIVGFLGVLVSPIIIILLSISSFLENRRKNYTLHSFTCENCSVLMSHEALELAKTTNIVRRQKRWAEIEKMEWERKNARNDPNATPVEKMLASAVRVHYKYPPSVDAICCHCGTEYIYSSTESKFKISISDRDL